MCMHILYYTYKLNQQIKLTATDPPGGRQQLHWHREVCRGAHIIIQ